MKTLREASARHQSEALAGALATIGNGAVVRAGSRILITVCTFVTTALVVRALGAERYGPLAFALSIVGLITGLFAGLGTAATRSIASALARDDAADDVIRALTAVVIVVAGVGAAAVLASIAVTQRQLDGAEVWALGVSMSVLLLGRERAPAPRWRAASGAWA